jgi:hypothetical protein
MLTVNVLPKSSDRWLALAAGGPLLVATTAVTVAALPTLPAATAFVVGIGTGVAGMTLAGVLVPAFRRPAAARPV